MLHEFAARGSIARTAEALGYTPSAVSQQLAVLEKEAGTPLLDRTARSAGLTDAGKRLAIHAERILAMVEAAEADLSAQAAQPSGRVVVAAFPSAAVAFAPALARSLQGAPAPVPAAARGGPRGRAAAGQVGRGRGRDRRRLDGPHVGRPGGRGRRARRAELLPPRQGPAHPGGGPRPPGRRPGTAGGPAGPPQRIVARRPRRRAVAAGRGPAARRRRANPAGPVGVRGPRHGRQPGRPRPRHRDHAAARGRRLREAGRRP